MILIMTVCWKSFFERTRAIIHSFWLWENDCVRLVVRLWVGPGFGVRVIIQAITHTEERGSRHGGWGVLLLGLKANGLCAGEPVRERGGVRVLTVKWWAVLVHRWVTAGRVRVAGSLPTLTRLLPVCPPRPASQLTLKSSRSLSLPPSYFFLVISLEMTPHANGIQF